MPLANDSPLRARDDLPIQKSLLKAARAVVLEPTPDALESLSAEYDRAARSAPAAS